MPDGNLVVRAPIALSNTVIEQFINSKEKWIIKKQMEIREKQIFFDSKKLENGTDIFFLGDLYPQKINPNQAEPILFDNGFHFAERYKDRIRDLLIVWYKIKAHEIISKKIAPLKKIHGLNFKTIKITSAQKRWGSCTKNKTLNFSWKVIMLPEPIIDYIVIHELTHLEEFNHSKKFWDKVKDKLPDYNPRRQWLKNNHYKFTL